MSEIVGPASTQYSDFTGTVACEPGVEDERPLLELAELDPDRYQLWGVKVYNETGSTFVRLFVVETTNLSEGHQPEPRQVIEYVLDDNAVAVGDFIDQHFKRFEAVATNRGEQLEVVSRRVRDDDGQWQEESI